MPNDPRCEELRALGGKRTATADFFGERMIAEDDIPGGPPEERSLVETVLARARAAFADEGMDALLADCPVQVGPLAPHLDVGFIQAPARIKATPRRSEEHTSELQSLMRISYAVFCLKKKKKTNTIT